MHCIQHTVHCSFICCHTCCHTTHLESYAVPFCCCCRCCCSCSVLKAMPLLQCYYLFIRALHSLLDASLWGVMRLQTRWQMATRCVYLYLHNNHTSVGWLNYSEGETSDKRWQNLQKMVTKYIICCSGRIENSRYQHQKIGLLLLTAAGKRL